MVGLDCDRTSEKPIEDSKTVTTEEATEDERDQTGEKPDYGTARQGRLRNKEGEKEGCECRNGEADGNDVK